MTKPWIVRILWIAVLFAFAQVRGQTQTLVLDGGTLIDGNGGTPIQDAVIVVEGSRIKAVGVQGKISYPQSAKVIKTDGKTILPGLIDPHIHLRDWMPQMFLHYGVTTVADTNNHRDWILVQRDAWNSGNIKGPRMFVTGMAVAGPPAPSNDTSYPAKTVEAARAFVKNAAALGVDAIKVDSDLTLEQLQAIVEEAGKAGVPVVGHTKNIRKAVQVGMKFMEHTDTLVRAILEEQDPAKLKEIEEKGMEPPESLMDPKFFDPLIQLMVKEGVFINPTLTGRMRAASPRAKEWAEAAKEIVTDPGLAFVPADVRQSWTEVPRRNPGAEGYQKVQEFVRRYVEAGGKIVAGTDAGFMPGLSLHYEMQLIVDAGVPPMKALLGATKWAAEVIGKQKDLGTVEGGKLADLTVVEGNPLDNFAATKNIHLVIKNGQVLDTAYDPKFANPVPRPVGLAPEISSVTPTIARQGDPSVTVQVTGDNFHPHSVVRFDTTDLQTQFISDIKLTATIDSRLLQKLGSYPLTVVNPGSGGGTSNGVYFIVNFKQ